MIFNGKICDNPNKRFTKLSKNVKFFSQFPTFFVCSIPKNKPSIIFTLINLLTNFNKIRLKDSKALTSQFKITKKYNKN